MSPQPFSFSSQTGCLTAEELRNYAEWIKPRLKIEWTSPGVIKREKGPKQGEKQTKPYEFRKSKGWLNLQRDIRPFVRYVLEKLRPWSDREPYVPARTEGMAFLPDLIEFDAYVRRILKRKQTEQSAKKS